MSLLSQHHHLLNPDVLASPVTGGFICQQYTGETYSSCLFSPLADVSTSSGMHSSCPSFAHVTNVCLAVCKIRSPSFFFYWWFFFPVFLFSSMKRETLQPCSRPKNEDRQKLFASSCDSIKACNNIMLCVALVNKQKVIHSGQK